MGEVEGEGEEFFVDVYGTGVADVETVFLKGDASQKPHRY